MSGMENREALQFKKEATNWSPSVKIVPHHLFRVEAIGRAFIGDIDPQLSAQKSVMELNEMRKSGDQDGYFADLLGKTTKESEIFERNNAALLQQIKDLPYNSTVHMDLIDNICKGCAVGAHCTAVNALMIRQTGQYELTTPLESELDYLRELQGRLENNDFLEGLDYRTQITHHTLVNFGGNFLNEPPKNPRLIQVEFPSLLVRTTAMRALFGRADSPDFTK